MTIKFDKLQLQFNKEQDIINKNFLKLIEVLQKRVEKLER